MSVVVLDLRNCGLRGQLPEAIGSLTNLTALGLQNNHIFGPLPASFSGLSELVVLDLSNNMLQGNPFNVIRAPNLKTLFLSSNNFSSVTRLSFDGLTTALTSLEVANANLEGPIEPHPVLSGLKDLNLVGNRLSGSLLFLADPVSAYVTLRLAYNAFCGDIPTTLLNQPSLVFLDLSNNNLTAHLAHDALLSARSLRAINLSYNRGLTGMLPDGISRLPALEDLLLHQTGFEGPLPAFDGAPALRKVDLSGNNFYGPIPTSWYQMPSIVMIDISSNARIDGSFPSAQPSGWTRLVSFESSNTNITGSIPSWVDTLATSFSLAFVSLTGNDGILSPTGSRQPLSIEEDSSSQQVFPGDFVCSQYRSHGGAKLLLPPQYFSYSHCQCLNGYWGIPPTCLPCGVLRSPQEDLHCPGGSVAVLPLGQFPVFGNSSILLGFDRCPWLWRQSVRWPPCNPNETAKLHFGRWIDDDGFCAAGYTGRLCSKCTDDSYGVGRQCVPCAANDSVWLWIGLGVLVSTIVIFVALPRVAGGMFVWGEIAVFLVLVVIDGSSSWILTLLIVLVAVQVLLHACHARVAGRVLISPSGFVKLFVFFIQTNSTLNGDFWGAFQPLLQAISIVRIQVSRIRCSPVLGEALFSSAAASFLVYMAIPLVLFLAALVILVLRIIVQKVRLVIANSLSHRAETVQADDGDDVEEEDATARLLAESDSENVSRHGNGKGGFGAVIVTMALFLLFVMYFDLTERILSVFRRSQSIDGSLWMEESPWIPWDVANAEFRTLLICACVFGAVYVVGIPVLLSCMLRHHDNEDHPAAFLWENYKPGCYWFELVWLARRFLLAAVIAILEDGSGFRPFLIVGLLGTSALVQFLIQPFQHAPENAFDMLSTVIILATFGLDEWAVGATQLTDTPPPVFYVALVCNVLYIILLAGATSFPLLGLCRPARGASTSRELHGMQQRDLE